MEFINIPMEIIILEIGKKIFFTDMEYIFLHQLVKDMKDIVKNLIIYLIKKKKI
jgi:hypothetical protein